MKRAVARVARECIQEAANTNLEMMEIEKEDGAPPQDLRKYMVGIKRKARAVKEVQEEFMEIDDIGSKKDPKERKKVISTLADIVSTILDVFY